MSETVFMILCIKCKSEFNQGDTNRRFCNACRYNKDAQQRLRAHLKRELKRKQERKLKPEFFHKICPVCEREFKTKLNAKKYCTKKCNEQTSKLPIQLERAEARLIRKDKEVINVNKMYQERINKLCDQLDYYNKNANDVIEKEEKNIQRIKKILTSTDK